MCLRRARGVTTLLTTSLKVAGRHVTVAGKIHGESWPWSCWGLEIQRGVGWTEHERTATLWWHVCKLTPGKERLFSSHWGDFYLRAPQDLSSILFSGTYVPNPQQISKLKVLTFPVGIRSKRKALKIMKRKCKGALSVLCTGLPVVSQYIPKEWLLTARDKIRTFSSLGQVDFVSNKKKNYVV